MVKVGVTTDLRRRMKRARVWLPVSFEVTHFAESEAQAFESELHGLLSGHHVRGEWFLDNPDTRSIIAARVPVLVREVWKKKEREARVPRVTTREVDMMIGLRRDRLSVEEIGRVLHRPRVTVFRHLKKHRCTVCGSTAKSRTASTCSDGCASRMMADSASARWSKPGAHERQSAVMTQWWESMTDEQKAEHRLVSAG